MKSWTHLPPSFLWVIPEIKDKSLDLPNVLISSTYLFIYLSIYLFIYLFVYLFIYLFICLFIYLFIYLLIYSFFISSWQIYR